MGMCPAPQLAVAFDYESVVARDEFPLDLQLPFLSELTQ
jgi:hypothetical protein